MNDALRQEAPATQAHDAPTVNHVRHEAEPNERDGCGSESTRPDEPDAALELLNLEAPRYLNLAQIRAEFPRLTRTRPVHGAMPWDYSAGEAA
jgi:hypothetical protein